jgi:hypothetical protein
VRMLGFARAAELVVLIGQTLAPHDPNWLAPRLHCLKHSGPEPLLTALHQQVAGDMLPIPKGKGLLGSLPPPT